MTNQIESQSNPPLIGRDVFKGLMENLKCETGNDRDAIGFSSKFKGYEISFYGELEDNYELNVEDFGKMVSGKWLEIEPTDVQIEIMEIKLKIKLTQIETAITKAETERYKENQIAWELEKYGREGEIY